MAAPPRNTKLVDEATGCEMLSPLDCFSTLGPHEGVRQRENKFHWDAQGLKNAGSLFNRALDVVLGTQEG